MGKQKLRLRRPWKPYQFDHIVKWYWRHYDLYAAFTIAYRDGELMPEKVRALEEHW